MRTTSSRWWRRVQRNKVRVTAATYILLTALVEVTDRLKMTQSQGHTSSYLECCAMVRPVERMCLYDLRRQISTSGSHFEFLKAGLPSRIPRNGSFPRSQSDEGYARIRIQQMTQYLACHVLGLS